MKTIAIFLIAVLATACGSADYKVDCVESHTNTRCEVVKRDCQMKGCVN